MTLRIFESVFYKSLIRACSFDNSLAASQNARSYGQTINHRALRICKKRIQKLLMLSTLIIINIAFHVLSVSYNGTLFKPLQSVYVKLYWISALDDCYWSISISSSFAIFFPAVELFFNSLIKDRASFIYP